jgi:hypothetical protein
MVATDNGTHGGAGGRGARLSKWAALALMGLAIPAQAQEARAASARVRRVTLTRVPASPPATLYGAADKSLLLVFDVALGRGAVRAPGVAIQRSTPNTLVLTPSRASARGPLLVTVPLQTGAATFALVLKPEATDRRVYVIHSEDPEAALAQKDQLPIISALATEPLKLERSNATVPDAIVKCRMSLRVRSPGLLRGATVEIRTPDRSLCESANTLNMRAGSGR